MHASSTRQGDGDTEPAAQPGTRGRGQETKEEQPAGSKEADSQPEQHSGTTHSWSRASPAASAAAGAATAREAAGSGTTGGQPAPVTIQHEPTHRGAPAQSSGHSAETRGTGKQAVAGGEHQHARSALGSASRRRTRRLNTRLWWNAQAGSAGGRVLMDGSTLQPAAPGGAAGAATSRFPEVAHPCMHGGYSAPYKRLVQGGIAPEPPVVQLLGVPNFNACMALGERLVRLANASCPPNRQATAASCILGALQPPMSGVFTAITGAGAARYYCCQDIELACATVVWVQASPKRAVIRSPASTRLPIPAVAGFYVVSAFLHVPPDASSQALIPAARRLCSQPWSRVKAEMGGALNAERFCTWGGYTAALLSHGLRLGAAGRVTFGRGDMGWPLGAALLEASRLPGFMADGGRIGSPISGAWGQAGPRQSSTGGGGWWSGPVWQLTLLVAASVMGAWLALRPRLLAVQPGRAPSAVRPRMLSATGLPVFSAAPRKAAAA